jgi:hypothetical protein
MFSRTSATVLLLALVVQCCCMPLPWPSEGSPSPFSLRSWVIVRRACTGTGMSVAPCTHALIQASASERPTAMLVASAAWRHAAGDVYGSAHALQSALSLLHKSSGAAASQPVETTDLFQEILRILRCILDITPPPPSSSSSSSFSSSSLSTLYPAQITPFSDFAAALLSVCRHSSLLRIVIEVGSGAGAGSSSAIIGGILRRPHFDQLRVFLIEIGAERRARLNRRYAHLPFVRIIAASAVPLSHFPTAAHVAAAHAEWSDAEFPLSDALEWRQQDWDYLQIPGTAHDGLGTALAAARASQTGSVTGGSEELLPGESVDVAVLDGSEFTGWQEMAQVYGARIIALDDTRALKHRRSRAFLQASGCYTTVADMLHDRNGWAIFERIPGRACAPPP